jgi:3-oxoacyl-[acyl-carrier protein] reductase
MALQSQMSAAALITGGSRGIGAATALELARRGVDVAITYRTDTESAEALVARIVAEYGVAAVAIPMDQADPESPPQAVAAARAALGRIDRLIANAGIWKGGTLARLDDDTWWEVVQTNLGGTRAVVKAALPALAEDGGSVVLVSSTVALNGFAGDTSYASAKAALIGFGRSLAKEVAPQGITVNILAPGFVETDMTAAVPDSSRERIEGLTVLGRFGRVEEIARAATFLAVDADYCTGVVLPVDGGWTL